MKKNITDIVEILDKMILNNDMSEEDFKYLRNYIKASISKYYDLDADTVTSDFLLYAKENYTPDMHPNKKCSWISNAISGLVKNEVKSIVKEKSYVNFAINAEEVVNDEYKNMTGNLNLEYLDNIYKENFTPLEYDIYKECLLWDSTYKSIADEYWVSVERVRKKADIVKEKIKKTLDF